MSGMKRREFITLLGGAAAAWPLAARAQQPGKLPTIGSLGADATVWSSWTAAFVARLRELGWIEGRTVAIEYRWSQGRQERVAEIAAARTLSIEVAPAEIRRAEDIGPTIEAVKAKAEALYVVVGALIGAYRTRIITSALGARLPTLFSNREQVQAGGLMSYGPSVPDMFHRTADLVDKILRGAKPGDIPVEQPTRFELVINLTTAKALGLEIPPTLLAVADEVIE